MEIKGFSARRSRGSAEMAFSFKNKPAKVFPVHGETSPQMNLNKN
jgi:hypothetical protein